jgi:hypothetical protein
MRTSGKIVLATLAASVLLASAVSTASAGRLSISNQFIRATWRNLEFIALATIRCPVTLEGSFHSRTITKVTRLLIAAITKVTVKQESCNGGRIIPYNGSENLLGVAAPQTLPWHLTYESFVGTLPSIERIRFLLARFRFAIESMAMLLCEYGRNEDVITLDAIRSAANGSITTLTPLEGRNRVTRNNGIIGFCQNEGVLRGDASVMLLNTTNSVSVFLI